MIKRRYFVSVRIAHNDGSGQYSWWNTIINTCGWKADPDGLLCSVRELSTGELNHKVPRAINDLDVEVIALNKI